MTLNCICNEGIIHFPDNAKCQTINVISLASGQAINITRDRPADGENFEGYLQGQLRILVEKCNNYKQLSLQHCDSTAVFSKISKLTFSFKPAEGITYWQYIILAEREPGNIMLFTSVFMTDPRWIRGAARWTNSSKHSDHTKPGLAPARGGLSIS